MIPPTAMSGVVKTMTRTGPILAAIAESPMVRSASSTMVAVKTPPISAAEKPRRAR